MLPRSDPKSSMRLLCLIVLRFNDTLTLVGHFVSSPSEREKRDKKKDSKGDERERQGGDSKEDERERQGRKRNRRNKNISIYSYLLHVQG